ncbi:MAG: ABC transporter permease [Chitinophagaceae bacterium]
MKNVSRFSRIMLRFFRWFADPQLSDSIEGDLLELYYQQKRVRGVRFANRVVFKEVMLLFRPAIIRSLHFAIYFNQNVYAMYKNYFKTALRNLQRHKANSAINILGLVVGFAAFLLIFLVVQYESSFEDFHKNKNEIYRIVRDGRDPQNPGYRPGVPFPVTATMRAELPQLQNAAAIFSEGDIQVSTIKADGSPNKKFKEEYVFMAEPQFFQLFNFELAEGNIKTALNDVNTVLLTKDIATKYFGNWQTAMGQTIKVYGKGMKVTGILNNVPPNSDFPLGIVVSYATMMKNRDSGDWGSISDENYCFVQLNRQSSVAQLQKQINEFTDKHIKPVNDSYLLKLEPLKEMHYDSRYGTFTGKTFSKDLILALSIIGLFLLIIACVNFINITTAHAVNRAREVGVRKVLGSNQSQLVLQFLTETAVTTLLAIIGAIGIALLCIPLVNDLLEIHVTPAAFIQSEFILIILSAFLGVTLFAGFYPALVLSGFRSINVLKGAALTNIKGVSLRRGLVVFQFVIAQALIIGTLVVASQMNYFQNADLGFKKDAIINASFPRDSVSRTKIDFLFNELTKINGVKAVGFSTFAPSTGGGWYTDLRDQKNKQNKEPDMIVTIKPADTNFFKVYNIQLLAGKIYFQSDTMRDFVVNENVIKKLGIQNPELAIGRMINVSGTDGPIVGVVKDFHTNSLRDEIIPTVLTSMKRAYGLANIQINLSKTKDVISSLRDTWNKYYPDYVFEYNFIDQKIADYYKQENQVSVLYKIFSGIAIFISCLGLYGLIAFMAVQKRKEIGIRKVLGAPVHTIVMLLSKEFTFLIGIAFLIAAPLAWYFMHQWLQQYTYRISMGAWFFIITVAGSVVITWLTVGYTAIKAALASPVRSLRTE